MKKNEKIFNNKGDVYIGSFDDKKEEIAKKEN